MPRRKKKAHELTTDEAMRKLFPKKVVDHLRKQANPDSKSSIKHKDTR